MRTASALLIVLLATCAPALAASAGERLDMRLRDKTLALTVYRSQGTPKGTVIMGSGDVGWVGLAVTRARELSSDGYAVIGLNIREYLSAFTTRSSHLSATDIQQDFGALSQFLAGRGLLVRPVLLSGVSEGAGIAVVAAAAPQNHTWIAGVITMGLPELSEIAWRWSDFTTWITKKDAAEPSVRATEFVSGIAPVPLAMLQSSTDEYVPEADYRAIERAAGEPKQLTLIAASNHRFTDKQAELRKAYAAALDWIATHSRDK